MTRKRNWIYRPIVWAITFMMFDGIWVLLMYLITWTPVSNNGDLKLSINFIVNKMIAIWNVAHKPMRTVIEPILFPVVTFHPPTPSDSVFFLYICMCILQFAIIGYVVGVCVSWGKAR